MKIRIGPYLNFYGVYQIMDMIFFWQEKYPSDKLDTRADYKLKYYLQEKIADTFIQDFAEWIHSKRTRTVKIKIDKFDSWNVDDTLAMIIHPLLVELKKVKNGSPYVDIEDVPENLRYSETEKYDNQLTLDFYNEDGIEKIECDIHARWNWVLDEMIWAFEKLNSDDTWWNFTHEEADRVRNGLRLFGKYYSGLWW